MSAEQSKGGQGGKEEVREVGEDQIRRLLVGIWSSF